MIFLFTLLSDHGSCDRIDPNFYERHCPFALYILRNSKLNCLDYLKGSNMICYKER